MAITIGAIGGLASSALPSAFATIFSGSANWHWNALDNSNHPIQSVIYTLETVKMAWQDL